MKKEIVDKKIWKILNINIRRQLVSKLVSESKLIPPTPFLEKTEK